MPFIYSFFGALITLAGTLAGRVLIALGIGIATVTGVSSSLDWAVSYLNTGWDALPPQAYQILSALRIGTDIGIIVGAYSAKFALNGISSDSFSFWVMRGRIS